MALINNKNKERNGKENFIFFHLYKCGGMSLRKLLADNPKGSFELLGGHCLPKDLEKHYAARGKQKEFDEMFKFTIVRNPFDFLLSTYHYAKTFSNHFWHKDVIKMDFKDFPKFYLKYIAIHATSRPHGSNKVIKPYDYIHNDDGKIIVDFVGKLENYHKDIKYIGDKIGADTSSIPKVNVNKNNDKAYQDVYDKDTREFVEKHFAKDLEYFEYEF